MFHFVPNCFEMGPERNISRKPVHFQANWNKLEPFGTTSERFGSNLERFGSDIVTKVYSSFVRNICPISLHRRFRVEMIWIHVPCLGPKVLCTLHVLLMVTGEEKRCTQSKHFFTYTKSHTLPNPSSVIKYWKYCKTHKYNQRYKLNMKPKTWNPDIPMQTNPKFNLNMQPLQ